MVQYTGRQGEIPRYCCIRGMLDTGQPKCITFGGTAVDEAIRDELLRVVQPAAVESAIMASEEESHQQDVILEALQRDLEAARYCVQRAQKQYDLTDPENRLVAQELEQRWNAALQQVTDLETRMDRHIQSQGSQVINAHIFANQIETARSGQRLSVDRVDYQRKESRVSWAQT